VPGGSCAALGLALTMTAQSMKVVIRLGIWELADSRGTNAGERQRVPAKIARRGARSDARVTPFFQAS
jgi:hypothetical protein